MIKKLYEIFIKHDSTMIEINPMAEDSTGKGRIKYLIMTSQSLVAHTELIRFACVSEDAFCGFSGARNYNILCQLLTQINEVDLMG